MVTTLRATASPVVFAERVASEAPQARQNFAAGADALPHDGQRRSRRAPHSSQNADPTGFSWRHAEQFMAWGRSLQ
jgi:hypothetical protein